MSMAGQVGVNSREWRGAEAGSRPRQQTGPFREPDKLSAWSPATCQGSGLGRSCRH